VHGGVFATTHWSVVLAAGERHTPESSAALEHLCRSYWYPLYAYVRRHGYGPEDAQDLTQEFFAMLLGHAYLRLADPKRGRFRTFLLHALEHFMINEWKRAQRLKRGGGVACLPLDMPDGEQRYALEAATAMSPEQAYEKRWVLTLLDQVLASLRQLYTKAGKERLFEELAGSLWGKDVSPETESYAAVGQRLGMTEGAVRVAVHRLRERYRELLTHEVAQTVATPQEVEDELRYLLLVVSRKG
jgi:RNA polymerase sigma-70 factor (ECF subfamily)